MKIPSSSSRGNKRLETREKKARSYFNHGKRHIVHIDKIAIRCMVEHNPFIELLIENLTNDMGIEIEWRKRVNEYVPSVNIQRKAAFRGDFCFT